MTAGFDDIFERQRQAQGAVLTEDDIRRIAREEFAAFLADQPQRLMPTVVNGCPRGCLTNTVCLRPDCALLIRGE